MMNPVHVKILRDGAKLPTYGTAGAAGADLYAAIGVPFTMPWVGRILTGIFASRGANFVSDLVSTLTAKKQE